MQETVIIYVSVKGRHEQIWEPVQAINKHGSCYQIIEKNADPEHWYQEFDFGEIVLCEENKFAEDEFGLIALEKCEHIFES